MRLQAEANSEATNSIGAGGGSKKFRKWGSESELRSIKFQEELEAEALKIWLLPHPCLRFCLAHITFTPQWYTVLWVEFLVKYFGKYEYISKDDENCNVVKDLWSAFKQNCSCFVRGNHGLTVWQMKIELQQKKNVKQTTLSLLWFSATTFSVWFNYRWQRKKHDKHVDT